MQLLPTKGLQGDWNRGKLCNAGTVRLLPSLPQLADAPATYQATCRMVLIIATDEVDVDADMFTSEECMAVAS